MKLFTTVFLMVIMTFLFGNILNKIETIEQLQNQLKQNNQKIDSLFHEIDTLQWENQIWDRNFPSIHNETQLLSAIIHVESSNNDSAYHIGEDAVGCLQIRKCMVDDVNRILRRQDNLQRYTYDDRWVRYKSIRMFEIYCKHYKLTTSEEISRCWNGGPRGMDKPLTTAYWRKVQKGLDS